MFCRVLRLAKNRHQPYGKWESGMIAKPIAFIQVPTQRLFGTKAAARYLGVHEQTLRKLTAEGALPSRRLGSRRVYVLDDLDRFIADLPSWYGCDAVPGQKGAVDGD